MSPLVSLNNSTHSSIEVSISSTFNEQFSCMKVFFEAILFSQFGFVIFWQDNFGAKAARKMLVN
jgi:hypothetical protein